MTPERSSPEKQPWPNEFKTSRDVASGLNWLRWKTADRAQILIAIGRNSVAVAKAPACDPEDAIEMLQTELDTITRLIRELGSGRRTHAAVPRPDGR